MATTDVTCPYCGVEAMVTAPREAAIAEVRRDGSSEWDASDAACPNGHQFQVLFSAVRSS